VRKKPQQHGHSHHERWLVSYADFITLLFAFFVMMYAHSQTDKARAVQISEAFHQALSEGRLLSALEKLLGNKTPRPEPPKSKPTPEQIAQQQTEQAGVVQLLPSLQQLNDSLSKEIASGRLEIRMERRGLVISLKEATFFPSGGDTVDPQTLPTLQIIAAEVGKHPNPIRLEGHTDSKPIRTPRFRSNWDLSAARGIAMLDLFADRFGISRNRMAIAGFADTAPVASNDTEEGRARNRRVDIVVLNETAILREPRQTGSQ
jgi:chemotaxis protein MotB